MIKADRLVLDQAIRRNLEIEDRRKKEHPLPKGIGNIVIGSIHDCNRIKFRKMLRDYSDRLYAGWNPFKKDGQGCWEVWHRPTYKTPVLAYKDDSGLKIWITEYKPNDFEHWVADLDYLSYDFISKLREMDSWENRQLISGHDDKIEESRRKDEQSNEDNIKYVVKHNKALFRDLLDYTQAGYDPLQFFTKK